MVLPSTYFTTQPFENWTRNATEIMGTVDFDVDFTVPLPEMRAELDRLLAESELWDGRRGVVQVTDAVGGCARVRMLVSAPNSGALFDLRCAIREGMLDWLQRTQSALPRYRLGSADETLERRRRGTVTLIGKCSGAVGFGAVAMEHRWMFAFQAAASSAVT